MRRLATSYLDLYLLSHALARFELRHHGYPLVATPGDLTTVLVPAYLSRIPERDPWGRLYSYDTHKVLVSRHPKVKAPLTDSYELKAQVIDPETGFLLPLSLFNGTFIEAPIERIPALLALREYPSYPGPADDVRGALKMFGLQRPLELVKLVALRVIEDMGDRHSLPHLKHFLRFNEPERLKTVARDALRRFGP